MVPKCVFERQADSSVSVLELHQQQRIRLVEVRKSQLHTRAFILHRPICPDKEHNTHVEETSTRGLRRLNATRSSEPLVCASVGQTFRFHCVSDKEL